MLLPSNINPTNSLYYNGAFLIEVLSATKSEELDILTLFDYCNEKNEISLKTFILTLDWLYLLGLVSHEGDGRIKKCF